MKKILTMFCTLLHALLFPVRSSTNTNPDFEKNLAIAKKFIELHAVEDWQSQATLDS
jgi:hypothetical protein